MASKSAREEAVEQSLDALNALEPTADRSVQNAVVQQHLERVRTALASRPDGNGR